MNQRGYCPVDFGEKNIKREERKCTGCSLCAISCPEVAIEVHRG
jgi:MinD superfamily P-loop ATPase